jgi:hypothetical protein
MKTFYLKTQTLFSSEKKNTMTIWRFMPIAFLFMAMSFKSSAQLCPIPPTITISISGCGVVNGTYTLSSVSCQQVFGFINYEYEYQLPNGDEIKLGGFNNYPVYLNQTYLTYFDASANSYAINDFSNRYCSNQPMVWPENFLSDFSPCFQTGSCTTATYSENSDEDGDGVDDADDLCPNTPSGDGVNTDGCSCSQVTVNDGDPCTLDACTNGIVTNTFQDADGDGVCDANDVCPGGDDNLDNDGDGTPDFCDDDDDNDGILDRCDTAPFVDNYTFNGIGSDFPTQWLCGNNNNKVLVCKVPPGNSGNAHTICVNSNAVQSHLNNGSYLGECTCTGGSNFIAPNNEFNTVTPTNLAELEVFPNPAIDIVKIHLHGFESAGEIIIFDLSGKLLFSQKTNVEDHELTINVGGQEFINGVYMIRMISEDLSLTKRLVIQR